MVVSADRTRPLGNENAFDGSFYYWNVATPLRSRRLWTIAIFLFVGAEAVGFQLRGALLPSIKSAFTVSTSLLGLVATAGTVGFVASVFTVGLFAGRINAKRTFLASAAVVSVAVFTLGIAPTFTVFLAALFVRGVVTGPFRALDRAVLGHLYPDARARMYNLYAVVWAVGAAAGPLLAAASLAAGDWRFAYLGLGVAFLPVVVLFWRLELPDPVSAEQPLSFAGLRSILRTPSVMGVSAAVFLSSGVEGSLFTWLPFFATNHVGLTDGTLILFSFLLAYIPARLGYSVIVQRVEPLSLVIVIAVVAGVLLLLLTSTTSRITLLAIAFALGGCISGIFPTLSAFAVDSVPAHSGPVNAVANAAGFGGIAVFPAVVGVLADIVGIATALWALPALLTGFVLLILLTRRKASAGVGA